MMGSWAVVRENNKRPSYAGQKQCLNFVMVLAYMNVKFTYLICDFLVVLTTFKLIKEAVSRICVKHKKNYSKHEKWKAATNIINVTANTRQGRDGQT